MGSETLPLKHAFTLCSYPAGPHFAAKRAAAMDVNTAEASLPEPPDTPDFTDLLEFTLPATLPANPDDTPEIRARKLASAQRQFAAFQPTDEADAQEAIAAIAAMQGAMDSLARAAQAWRRKRNRRPPSQQCPLGDPPLLHHAEERPQAQPTGGQARQVQGQDQRVRRPSPGTAPGLPQNRDISTA